SGTSQFGVLAFNSAPILDGTLAVTLAPAYEPNGGDTFQILAMPGGSHSGDFASTSFPSLSGGKAMSRAYNGSGLLLSVSSPVCTPAPSGIVDWYRAEGNANDGIGPRNGTLANGASFVA